jgi:aquaporin Z
MKYVIEFIGTFFLVLTVGLTANPLAIGAVLVAMVYMGGYISGAHYNPAITLAVWMRRKISTREALWYVAVQLVAALVASAIFFMLKGTHMAVNPSVSLNKALLCEAIFTFALVSVVLHTAVSKRAKGNEYYGLAIGLALMAGAFAAGPISGGALNPAVGLGPNLFDLSTLHNHYSNLLLYSMGPLLGGIVAAVVFGATTEMRTTKA